MRNIIKRTLAYTKDTTKDSSTTGIYNSAWIEKCTIMATDNVSELAVQTSGIDGDNVFEHNLVAIGG